MKIGRTEKIWLASVLFFWVVYIGCKRTEKEYPLIEDEEQDETAEDNTPAASETQKESDK